MMRHEKAPIVLNYHSAEEIRTRSKIAAIGILILIVAWAFELRAATAMLSFTGLVPSLAIAGQSTVEQSAATAMLSFTGLVPSLAIAGQSPVGQSPVGRSLVGQLPAGQSQAGRLPMGTVSFGQPASSGTAGSRVAAIIGEISRTLKDTRYQHQTRVSKSRGAYYFDCSGMAEWVLKQAAPRALKSVGRPENGRPLARDFFRAVSRLKPGQSRGAWKRIERFEDALPGDVLSWIRPKWFPSKSTGHVAFVIDVPRKNTGPVQGVLLRIADASKFQHENDTRKENETGFGIGTLLVPTDGDGAPIGYGWFGSETEPDWVVPTEIVIGRPLG